MTSPITEDVIGALPKGADLEIRVRSVAADGEQWLDIREYVPSSDVYGRGLLVPFEQRAALAKLIKGA